MCLLKFQKMHSGHYRFICQKDATFVELKNKLAELYGVYRQRVLLIKEFTQFGHKVFDVNIVGDMPNHGI